MLNIHFMDWGKNRPKKHYKRLHEMRIFELIFSSKITELGVGLSDFKSISVFCLANSIKTVSFDEDIAIGDIKILVPYDYMSFLKLGSTEDKFQEFSELVRRYIVPAIKKYSKLPTSIIESYVEEALNQIVKQNFEAVFIVDKTPRKSPSRKKMAILKGIHRSEGFHLRCEVYNEKGLRIIDELLVEEVGNEIVYARFLGTLKWEKENLILVKSKSSSWKAELCL
ncbi:hypothetical protein [Neobacillus kokaensis]|uniref:Uncharacterized protein n=1 Tax=Neobacillus kokaensis TaxID=2759023 RepID=A0ABQ3NBT2_9BACI|nr:hypothetical protein [Neobacillus kokaensis]GHI01381.1 hypothetical protein AM1BK_49230 [Neobacillus kokaensis]